MPLLILPELVELTPEQSTLVETCNWFIYACFAVDFALKIYLAPSAKEHIKRNWLDVIILALPLLRPLRILQGARALVGIRPRTSVELCGGRALETARPPGAQEAQSGAVNHDGGGRIMRWACVGFREVGRWLVHKLRRCTLVGRGHHYDRRLWRRSAADARREGSCPILDVGRHNLL